MASTPLPDSIHLPINSLALRRGGLVSAVVRRANALAVEGVEVWIEVLGAQSWLDRDAAKMRRTAHLDRRVRFRRVLDCLDPSQPSPNVPTFAEAQGVRVSRSDRVIDIVDNGLLTQRLTFGSSQRVRFVDYFATDGSRWRRDELDGQGRLIRDCRYRPGARIAHTNRWIGHDGRAFLTVEVDPRSGTWTGAYYWADDQLVHTSDMANVYTYAMDLALKESSNPLIFSEFRENLPNAPIGTFDDSISRITHPAVRRAVVAHSNHLAPPYTRGSGISPNWQRLIDNQDAWDAFLVWTPEQRADLNAQFGLTTPVVTMPPFAPEVQTVLSEADPDRFVAVARIQRKKRVDLAVQVFAEVARRRPSARLEIFGFGYGDDEEKRVQDLVAELGIEHNVVFKEFSSTQADLYSSATALLMTSQSEGFGQVLLESMAFGVPVVAFDANYGPRNVIEDGRNGFLVPFGDVIGAADRLVELSENVSRRAIMSREALATAKRFTPASYGQRWLELLRTI